MKTERLRFVLQIRKSEEMIEPLNYGNDVKAKSKKQFFESRKSYQQNPLFTNGNMKIFDEYGMNKLKR